MARWVNEIPIKVTAIKKRENKLNYKQMITLVIIIPFYVMLVITMVEKYRNIDSTEIKFFVLVVMPIITLAVIRLSLYLYFDEKAEYEKYKKYSKKPLISLSEYWDVLSISKNGVMMIEDKTFGGQLRSIVIKMERSSTIGRPDEFEIKHYEAVSYFLQKLLEKNYMIRRYVLMVEDSNEDKFELMEKNMKEIENNKLKETVKEILQYNRLAVSQTKNRNLEYYVILSPSSRDNIVSDITDCMGILSSRSIYKPEIIADKELIKFFKAFNKQSVVDVKSLMMNKLSTKEIFRVENIILASSKNSIFDVSVTKEDYVIERFNKLKKSLQNKGEQENVGK